MPRNTERADGLEDLKMLLAERAAQSDPADGILHQDLDDADASADTADTGDEPEEQLGEEPEFAHTTMSENQPDGAECQDLDEIATCAQAELIDGETEGDWEDERPMPPGFYLLDPNGYVYCEGGEFWRGRRFEAQRQIERLKGHGHGPWAILEVVEQGFTW